MMFDVWKAQTGEFVLRHIDRKQYQSIANQLEPYVLELSDLYTTILLENGVIDEHGDDTGQELDEDDLFDAMLERFLAKHGGDDERQLLIATLIDAYLTLVEESSEDI
jgi:hypothetical protein